MQSLPIFIFIHYNVHISTFVCRAALWTSRQSDTQVFASNLEDLILNAHTRSFATFRIVSWELLFMRVIRCFLWSRTLIIVCRYLLLNWLYTGHWNTKCTSVSCSLAQNGHIVLSLVVENRCHTHTHAHTFPGIRLDQTGYTTALAVPAANLSRPSSK